MPAAAQSTDYPRIGISAAPDRFQPELAVEGDELFQVHVLVLGPDDATPLEHGFTSFHWALLEACCGGAADIVDIALDDAWRHEGSPLGGMSSTSDVCRDEPYHRLATFTLRMATPDPGEYYVLCGPIGLARDCDAEGVVFTDMVVRITYDDATPAAASTLGAIKSLFR